jgi:hypothetical protein
LVFLVKKTKKLAKALYQGGLSYTLYSLRCVLYVFHLILILI